MRDADAGGSVRRDPATARLLRLLGRVGGCVSAMFRRGMLGWCAKAHRTGRKRDSYF